MSNRKRILVSSVFILAGSTVCAAAIAITLLYQAAFEEEQAHLVEIARGQARFMEAVARFDATNSQDDHPGGARAATLSQIAAAHERYPGFGETGELVIAQREGDQIVFLFPYRYGDGSDPDPIPWRSELAAPMRLALSGQDGALIGLDSRGERVLAAYHSVAVLNLGVVAKMDMAEIRAPFVMASAVAGGVTVLLVLAGGWLMLRLTGPLLRRLGLFQRFAEESGHGLTMADLNRHITYVNPALCRMLGLERQEEVLGKTFDPFYPEAVRRRVAEEIIPTVLEEGQWQGELAQLSKKGRVSPTFENIFLIRDENGNPTCLANIITDISERKQAEARQLDLLKIEQERNHLRDAVGALERVLGVVAHELRTPLAGLRAMAEFLLQEGARETQEFDTFLHSIHEEVVNMSGTVNDTLEVARMNSGVAHWNWSEVPVATVCEEALGTVRPLIDEATTRLSLEVNPGDLVMKGDPGAIRRLVVNLLSNSSKHTSEGSICVRATGQARENGPWVQIEVNDTGEGMPPEVAGRLGVAFALNSGVVGETHVEGSGLGLAICRGIVAAHGGSISIDTSPGKGTNVTVLLRADLSEPASVGNAAEIVSEVKP